MAESFHRLENKITENQGNTILPEIRKANQQLARKTENHIEKNISSLETKLNSMELKVESIRNIKPNCGVMSEEIIEEIKALSAEINTQKTIPDYNRSIAEEFVLLATSPGPSTQNQGEELNTPSSLPPLPTEEPYTKNSKPGWRIIGSKKIWKSDWTEFDAKQRRRRIQEKQAEKAIRRRTQHRKAQQQYQHSRTHSSDKELLATAKVQFAGPPSTIDHPIAGLSVNKLINFRKGDTINPYPTEKQQIQQRNKIQSPSTENTALHKETINPYRSGKQTSQENISTTAIPTEPSGSQFELDPMRPPIVRLTEQSMNGDGRFLKARLRDPKIMKIVRLYLAYMKDQQSSVCVEGLTPTSIKMLLASEGLPTATEHLQRIFIEVHNEYGLEPAEAVADLQAYRQFLTSERTHRLQQLRESATNFTKPTSSSNFRK